MNGKFPVKSVICVAEMSTGDAEEKTLNKDINEDDDDDDDEGNGMAFVCEILHCYSELINIFSALVMLLGNRNSTWLINSASEPLEI